MSRSTYTSPEDEAFFSAIGRLVISWAHIEVGIDYLVVFIHQRLGGNTIEKEMPRALQRKLDFLGKCFKGLRPLAQFKKDALSILKDIEEKSELRHDIIHGYIVDHPIEGSLEIKLARILREADHYREKSIVVTSTLVLQYAVDASKLGYRTIILADQLLNKFFRK